MHVNAMEFTLTRGPAVWGEEKLEEVSPLEPKDLRGRSSLYLMLGIAIGLLVAILVVLALMLFQPQAGPKALAGTTTIPAEQTSIQPAPRWFIWSGTGPLVGDSFVTEAECETARRNWVTRARGAAEDALRHVPPMSIGMIRALGYDPADRINEQYNQVAKAYCRTAAF